MRQSRRLAGVLFSLLLCVCLLMTSSVGAVTASLTMRLSTRTGPGTQYDEPGTYFQKDWQTAQVEVISADWDNHNDIWWVQVDFLVRGTRYRAYTGLKRVNVDINTVYKDTLLGIDSTKSDAKAYWGPGVDYAMSKYNVPSGTAVKVIDAENGFVQVEFYDARTVTSDRSMRRAWINAVTLHDHWVSQRLGMPSIPAPSPWFAFCPNCGKQLPEGNHFNYCPYCGVFLTSGN